MKLLYVLKEFSKEDPTAELEFSAFDGWTRPQIKWTEWVLEARLIDSVTQADLNHILGGLNAKAIKIIDVKSRAGEKCVGGPEEYRRYYTKEALKKKEKPAEGGMNLKELRDMIIRVHNLGPNS